MRVSFRFSMVVALITLVGAMVAVLTVVNITDARTQAVQAAQVLFSGAAKRVGERTAGLLEEARTQATVMALLPSLATPPEGDGLGFAALKALTAALKSEPSLYSIYVGYEGGEFLQVIQLGPDTRLKAVDPPEGTRLIVRAIEGGSGERTQSWVYLDAGGKVIGRDDATRSAYDPRLRPWYKASRGTDEVTLSDTYVYDSTGRIGMTMARAMSAGDGVLGVDLTIDGLVTFLRSEEISQRDFLFVLDGAGQVIAHQGQEVGGKLEIVPSEGHPIPQIAAVVGMRNGLTDQDEVTEILDIAGEPYILRLTSIPIGAGGARFAGGISAPVADFLGYLDLLVRNSLITAVTAFLVAVVIAFWIAGVFNRTIFNLIGEAERIRNLDLDEKEIPGSWVRELDRLAGSFSVMRDGLNTFGRYVPRSLVQTILDSGTSIEVGGQRQQVTALFSDIKDYTRISEKLDPEMLMTMTYRYFSLLGAAIERRQGIIDKFIGDAIMALWNAPHPDPDHVTNACLAVLEARIGNMVYNLEIKNKGLPELITRFGIHTGEAVVGNVGSEDRLNFTAIGSVINMASRLEGLNKVYGTEILITGDVTAETGELFVTRPIDLVAPVGADAPLTIYELGGVRREDAGYSPILWTPFEVLDLFRRWQEPYDLYLARRWPEAVQAFEALTADFPDDDAGRLYLERCRRFLTDPPPDDWDGALRMTSK